MKQELVNYLLNWSKSEGMKPCNEPEFIELFLDFMKTIDDSRDIEFDGEGAYFGKQVTIVENASYFGRTGFEIAYSKEIISVYTSTHNGFWTPEYLKLKRGEPYFDDVRDVLYETLFKLFALNELV